MSANTEPGAGWKEWAGLAVLALPLLLLSLDVSVLFLAAPHLGADLEPTSSQMLWIMDVYGFLIAGFLVTMGTSGDLPEPDGPNAASPRAGARTLLRPLLPGDVAATVVDAIAERARCVVYLSAFGAGDSGCTSAS